MSQGTTSPSSWHTHERTITRELDSGDVTPARRARSGDIYGSVADLKSSSGATEWNYQYGPFGTARAVNEIDTAAPTSPVQFNSQYTDDKEGDVWVDSEGVCHTVALPDPTVLMSEAFQDTLDQLLRTALEEVAQIIEAEEMRFYEDGPRVFPSDNEAEFVGVVPPEVLTEPVKTTADLKSLLRRLDSRRRLDALAALDDYLSGDK
jgi:hypothetical protein